MRDALDEAAAKAASLIDASDGTKGEMIAAIKNACSSLDSEFERIIVHVQREAASLADDVIVIELRRLGYDDDLDDEDDDEEEVRAQSSSSALVAALLLGALSMLALGEKKKPDLLKWVALNDYRLKRTAGTETFRAYSRRIEQYYDQLTELHPQLRKQWDATLDRRTCAVCRDHDGEIVDIDEDFSGGDVPGDVHINCRCVEHLTI